MTRRKARKLARNGRCETFWGSHGCRKPAGHIGRHLCSPGCEPGPLVMIYPVPIGIHWQDDFTDVNTDTKPKGKQ